MIVHMFDIYGTLDELEAVRAAAQMAGVWEGCKIYGGVTNHREIEADYRYITYYNPDGANNWRHVMRIAETIGAMVPHQQED